ncbi:hypothetical protein WJX79_004681 [Trebouxia sp. C0005]
MSASLLQVVEQLLASGQYGDVAPQLDAIELQTVDQADLDRWPYAVQLLGHLYNSNLEDARFVYKRASSTHKQDTQLKAAFATLQHLWNKNYQGFWPLLTTTQWSEVTLPLVHAIAAKQRQDAVRLVSYAYSSIQPDRLASLTGTNPQEALQLAQSEGWQMNGDVIMVKREVQPDTHKESQDHLQHLTEFVVQLEV